MRFFVLFVLSALLGAGSAHAAPAGVIKTLDGSGLILRDNATMPARIGSLLQVNDTVVTADSSNMGIMLEDDTLLALGPASRLELRDFAFEPRNELFALAVRLLKGSFAYMSGVIGRLAPEKVSIETPDAVIAVHGTRFLVKVEGRQ